MDNPTIETLVQLLFHLAVFVPGTATLAAVLVNILKVLGVVQDDGAPVALNIINVIFAVLIGVIVIFFPLVNIPGLDATFGSLASTLAAFLPLLVILVNWLAPKAHAALRGIPLVGYSYSHN